MNDYFLRLRDSVWEPIFRTLASLLFGGLSYALWLILFLLSSPDGGALEIFLWLAAPLITALGFALGVSLFNRVIKRDQGGFARTAVWPLIGCILGVAAVYWFGPMLIVFSMLLAGTLSVALREFFHR